MDKKSNSTVDEPGTLVTTDFNGLRDALFEELNMLRLGKISNARARVTSQLAKRIIEVVTLDLLAQNLIGSQREIKRITDA